MFIEYAKASPEDILCRITAINRGPDAAPIHLLPHLWYRNRWSWDVGSQARGDPGDRPRRGPHVAPQPWATAGGTSEASDGQQVELLFTENETNFQRIDNAPNKSPYVKDGINDAVVDGKRTRSTTSKAANWPATRGRSCRQAARFRSKFAFRPRQVADPFADFDAIFTSRIAEADAFYDELHPAELRHRPATGRSAGVCRSAVVEAVLPLRRLSLAEGRPHAAAAARRALEGPQLIAGRSCTMPT